MKNKFFFKSTFLLSTLGMLGMAQTMGAQDRPNIILFLVDDMGWQETSVPFWNEETALNRRYHTPNMEKMAQQGVKFMQAYACAISSPSRCSLMSGMNAARHRVTNWTLNYNTKTDAGSSVINLPNWNFNGIQPAAMATDRDLPNSTLITSLPEILKANGYYTIHCGKAHFGSETTTGANPSNFGFDVNIAGGANGGPGSYLAENEYGSGSFHVSGLEKYYGTKTFLTEALTIEALNAIENPISRNQPFYLYMSHYAIHSPYDADSRFTPNYANVHDEQLNATLNQQEINHAALVEGMDKSLGDIMNYLNQHPDVAKNTVVLFMSDNGGQAVSVRQGRANYDQNYPARGGKGSSYEGGVHEPMMLYWPGNENVKPGTENQSRIMIEDFFPTILDLAGVKEYKTVQKVDGKSFADILRNPSIERTRTNIWHFPNLWGESQDKNEGYGAYSAIMKGDYHMLYFWETQERRLYNIKEDIGETNNLAKAEPEKLEELSKELTDSLKAYNAQRPSYKETGELIPWPDEAVQIADVGDVLKRTDQIFKLSNEYKKFYYTISDANANTNNVGGSYYWTLGTHYGYKAIQAKAEKATDFEELKNQLFYFLPGQDDEHFRIMTYNGLQVDYVDGETASSWNNGNPDQATTTVTTPYLQYGTETSGEFVIRKSSRTNYYGIGTSDGKVMNTRGGANGAAGIADMKWVINDFGGGLQVLDNNNGCQYTFTLYDDAALYYKEGIVTDVDQLSDGDLVLLQNVQNNAPSAQGVLYSSDARLSTRHDGLYSPELTWLKHSFDESSVFAVKKNGEQISFLSLSDGTYIPNDAANGEAYYLNSSLENTAFTLTPSSSVTNSWQITSTENGLSMSADQDCPIAGNTPQAFRIYKVSTTWTEQVPVWMYLATYDVQPAERSGRCIQVGKTEGDLKLWTAPTVEQNNETQMWTVEESATEKDLFALRNRAYTEETGVGAVSSGGTANARYTYDETEKTYQFVIEKGTDVKGTSTLNIRRQDASGWYVNASGSGQEFYVNEWNSPNTAGYMAGAWSPVLVADLKDTGDESMGALCSFAAPYPVILPEGVTAYIATSQDGDVLWLKNLELEDNILPASTPVILQSATAGSYPMLQTTNSGSDISEKNLFVASTPDRLLTPTNGCYVLSSQNGKVAFMNYTDTAIPAFRAYLPKQNNGATVMSVKFYNSPSTGIDKVEMEASQNTPIYNLMGQKVSSLQKGIYIQNGKKIVVK